jgi:hypothetical protein
LYAGLGHLVDHRESVEVKLLAFIVPSTSEETKLDYELLHVVVKTLVAIQLLLFRFFHQKGFFLLTFLIHDLNLDIEVQIVVDYEEGHYGKMHCFVYYCLENVGMVSFTPGLAVLQ